MKLHQTAIKQIVYKGDYRDGFCPAKWKHEWIDLNKSDKRSLSMLRGSYFEYKCGVNTSNEISLPTLHNKPIGVHEERILRQVENFKRDCINHNIIVSNNNTQIVIECPWSPSGFVCPICGSNDIYVEINNTISYIPFIAKCNSCNSKGNACDWANYSLIGIIDILSPISYDGKNYPIANIDLKLTGDITSDFGEYQWANFEDRDHLQMIYYSYIFWNITNQYLPCFYMVYDYKPKILESKIFHKQIEQIEYMELEQTIHKVIDAIKLYNKHGWVNNPSDQSCRNCNKECDVKYKRIE